MNATTACLCGAVTLAPMQSGCAQRATASPSASRRDVPGFVVRVDAQRWQTPRCAAPARASAPPAGRASRPTGELIVALLSALPRSAQKLGYEMATLSAPAISAPSPSVPASANSIAMRWSPWLSARPASQARPADPPAVGGALDVAAQADSPSATTARRSDSLARSSAASRDHRLAFGEQPEQRHQRNLVDRQRAPGRHRRVVAVQLAGAAPPGRPPARRRRRARSPARRWRPCARRMVSSPVRLGFRPTFAHANLRRRVQHAQHEPERGRREVARAPATSTQRRRSAGGRA